eukprot:1165051-Rhodomonas_salina.2
MRQRDVIVSRLDDEQFQRPCIIQAFTTSREQTSRTQPERRETGRTPAKEAEGRKAAVYPRRAVASTVLSMVIDGDQKVMLKVMEVEV